MGEPWADAAERACDHPVRFTAWSLFLGSVDWCAFCGARTAMRSG